VGKVKKTDMNLIRLTQIEVGGLGIDVHRLKKEIMHTSRDLSDFDLFKDTDTVNKDIYVTLKRDPMLNYEDTDLILY
jgi:hypothetical protein